MNKFVTRDLFYDRLGGLPHTEIEGPNGSNLLFYSYHGHTLIAQAYRQAGFECFVSTKSVNINSIFEELKAL